MKLSCLGLLALLAVLAAAPQLEGAITCDSVNQTLSPCLGYVGGGTLDPACCPALRSVVGSANTKPDRQSLCECTKKLAAAANPSQILRANELLNICRVTINFPISSTVDCSRVN